MATVIFAALGTLIGGPLGGAIGALVGRQVDGAIIGGPRQEGPRLKELGVTTSSYGTPIPRHYGRMRVPGTIMWATDLVEHPEVVAERIINYANIVGRENVQTNTDCGIGSRVGHEEVAWAKLKTMAEGAKIASERLWK